MPFSLSRALAVVLVIAVAIRVKTMFEEPSHGRRWLALTYSRLSRPVIGGLAPRINCDAPPHLLDEGSYTIILKSGYTIEQHKRAVGRSAELDQVVGDILDYDFPGFQVT